MPYLISRPTRRELRDRLRESVHKQGLDPQRFRGAVGRTEEAHEVQRRLEREGEPFERVFLVSGDSPEAKRAEAELKLRSGIDPESGERLKR